MSEEHAGYERALRRQLRNGTLAVNETTPDLNDGATLPLDTAVMIVLSNLDELTSQEQDGRAIDAMRWRRLGGELAYLFWLGIRDQ